MKISRKWVEQNKGAWFPCLKCDGHGACVIRVPDGTKRAELCGSCDGEGRRFANAGMIEEAHAIGSDNPFCAHDWSYSGTAYGGDDESYHGEGRCICSICGADGDA